MLKKRINNKYKFLLIILSFIILAIISDVVMLHTNILFSDYTSIQFHAKRIMEFKELLIHGDLSTPFSFNYFHGSAVMGMYPYLSLLPYVIFSLIIKSYVQIYNYSFIFIVLLSLLISFFSSLKNSKSKKISYLFAILYNISAVLIFNAFSNGDLGITLSLVFFPMAVFGFIDVLHGSDKISKLILGIFFISMSQIPTIFITCLFLLVLFILNIKLINKTIIVNIFKSIGLVIMLTSIAWIPFLKIILFNNINTPGGTSSLIKSSNVRILQNLGVIPVISVGVLIIFFNKFNLLNKELFIFSVLIIILSSTIFPMSIFTRFSIFKAVNKFQFTSRFLIIPQIILCYLVSKAVYMMLKEHNNFGKIWLTSLILLSIVFQLLSQVLIVNNGLTRKHYYLHSMNSPKEEYMIKPKSTKYLYAGYLNNTDYYPKSSKSYVNHAINNSNAEYDNSKKLNVSKDGYNTFIFINKKHIKKLNLPIFKYNDENIKLSLDKNNINYNTTKNNTISIGNVKKGAHKLRIKYIPNTCLIIVKNVLFLLGLVIVLFRNSKVKNIKYLFIK